ncbi:hypothetical protein NB640_01740 [Oxalobacter vibrioformis]|uniref:Uncharacterized protein n=1 Tax=Oxalobacter vibrioformis TaxID=933080 RepID=A0A9E9M052_9BURK|nr:hypothetical protein [Oxalobacter vibrioformis]WAW10413.1 hypothetical protein NB640_01740 [Oxalobacter vibrioformis]
MSTYLDASSTGNTLGIININLDIALCILICQIGRLDRTFSDTTITADTIFQILSDNFSH